MGSIIIALPRQETARKIKEILLRHGFGDTIVVSTAAVALQEIGRLSHGIVISGRSFRIWIIPICWTACHGILICFCWIRHRMSVTEGSRGWWP